MVEQQIQMLIRLVPLFPLLGFVGIGLLNKRLSEKVAGIAGCGTVFASFALSAWAFFLLAGTPESARSINAYWFQWVVSGSVSTGISFLYDPPLAVMMLIVTGVGFLIHVYSVGYMRGD